MVECVVRERVLMKSCKETFQPEQSPENERCCAFIRSSTRELRDWKKFVNDRE
jgi:hypothetical protein